MIGTAAIAAAPPSVSATGRRTRGLTPVGQPPAEPCADGDAGEDDADDARERLEGHADVRRQQASGEDLQHEHGAGGDEDEHSRQPAVHRRGTVPSISGSAREQVARLASELAAAASRRRLTHLHPHHRPPTFTLTSGIGAR